MEKNLDHLINILEESLNSDDIAKLTEFEKKLQDITQDIKKNQNDPANKDLKINEEKINHLSSLLKKFEAKQNERKNFLKEFDNFLKTRKFN